MIAAAIGLGLVIGVLVGLRRRAYEDGREVVLRETPPRVVRLLNATRLTRLFVLD